jgi:hypothetical protein
MNVVENGILREEEMNNALPLLHSESSQAKLCSGV